MRIRRVKLKNWRNFREAEAATLTDVVYILGPNASGKSNVLDALRFLRDIAKSKGGGLQAAIEDRGGLKKIRCLHARKETEVELEVDVENTDGVLSWTYTISFNFPERGSREPQVKREVVLSYSNGQETEALRRPNSEDENDPFRLRETHLEQLSANSKFRELAKFLGEISYVHLVPQLLKFSDQIGGRVVTDDPFGQEFMHRIARTNAKSRNARLRRIGSALQSVVPHVQDLRFVNDDITGLPHLEIRFRHHRPHGALQREDQFSDGTLRLISLLWLLQEPGESPLLLEEPELSLNEEIVRQLPVIISRIKNQGRSKKQVFITTHSYALLSNPGINRDGVVIISPSMDGSSIRKTNDSESRAIKAGLSVGEVVLPSVQKLQYEQLNLF